MRGSMAPIFIKINLAVDEFVRKSEHNSENIYIILHYDNMNSLS